LLAGSWRQVDFNNFADEDVGLLTGWGGVSWLFWQLGQKEVPRKKSFRGFCGSTPKKTDELDH
jgi:hypothetical protein